MFAQCNTSALEGEIEMDAGSTRTNFLFTFRASLTLSLKMGRSMAGKNEHSYSCKLACSGD